MPPVVDDECSVRNILTRDFKEVFEIEIQMKEMEKLMATANPNELKRILDRYGKLQNKFMDLDGYVIDSKISELCNKFRIDENMLNRKFNTLLGGEKVRLKLFELMQKNINLLVMDEPTNHIDITTQEVLEEALKEYPGTILFISHDRYFINKIAKKILYIEDKKITEYLGNYDDYHDIKVKQLSLNFKNKN